jgi:ssDNA thymidine ADP-ribosyltransferase, DarT
MANHPKLTYRGGQVPIIHLEADMKEVAEWADTKKRRWAFSLSNAGARYTEFRKDLGELDQVNWPAVAATDFRNGDIQEGKQAEFLLLESFPWRLVERIGVHSASVGHKVNAMISDAKHHPTVEVMRNWYF